jgi:hypothetical protein
MTTADSKIPSRTAQRLVVEYKKGVGNPPRYGAWQPLWDAKIDRIEINHGARPSNASIWFPTMGWDESPPVGWGDMVMIRTDEQSAGSRSVLFVGFAVNRICEFSGGSERPGAGFERNAVICIDHRWVLSMGQIHFGQYARGPDDYYPAEEVSEGVVEAKWDSDIKLTAQRFIFNPDGKPNKDPIDEESDSWPKFPLFCNPGGSNAVHWTARDMIRYLLHSSWVVIDDYLPITDPADLVGLEIITDDKDNWGKVLNHIVIEGLNVIEAVELVCKHIGWSFRLDYDSYGRSYFVFYKVGIRDKFYREESPVITHYLHAPKKDEVISDAVSEGRKMLWSMSLASDITPVVNKPIALGAPHRFEVTVPLVPAWFDDEFIPAINQLPTNPVTYDTSMLYFTDTELQGYDDPDSIPYFKYFHSRGSERKIIGRKWSLNESGFYKDPVPDPPGEEAHYDRGEAFDWKTVIPPEYIIETDKDAGTTKRLFAHYNRRLLPCLTKLDDVDSSVGYKLEFSFDGGVIWQVIPCSVRLLDNECGIFLEESNLAEIVDKNEGQIEFGPLAGLPLNLYTSLADDKYSTKKFDKDEELGHNRSFKDGEWRTRVRVTASVQMDRRIIAYSKLSPSSGSPFNQNQLYDWSDKYGLSKRTASSVYAAGSSSANEVDNQSEAEAHIDSLRKNNEDMSISGRFTLDRLWLGDGSGQPNFMVGDSIGYITGREVNLELLTFEGGKVSPEIIQIIYLPETQKQVLITRDLRFAEFKVDLKN